MIILRKSSFAIQYLAELSSNQRMNSWWHGESEIFHLRDVVLIMKVHLQFQQKCYQTGCTAPDMHKCPLDAHIHIALHTNNMRTFELHALLSYLNVHILDVCKWTHDACQMWCYANESISNWWNGLSPCQYWNKRLFSKRWTPYDHNH